MTYEEMMAMVGQGEQTGNLEDQIKRQMAQAEAMRGAEGPQMRNAGRVQVAPHPLELLGSLAKVNVGNQLERQAADSQKKVRALKQQQFAAMLQQMAGGQSQPAPAGPGFQLPSSPHGLQMPQN